jgi:hypothetical protein
MKASIGSVVSGSSGAVQWSAASSFVRKSQKRVVRSLDEETKSRPGKNCASNTV